MVMNRRNSLPPLNEMTTVQVPRPYSVSGADGRWGYSGDGKTCVGSTREMEKGRDCQIFWGRRLETLEPLRALQAGSQCILRMIKAYYTHLLWTFTLLRSMMEEKCVLCASSLPAAVCSPGGEVPLLFFAGTAFHGHTVHGINLYI